MILLSIGYHVPDFSKLYQIVRTFEKPNFTEFSNMQEKCKSLIAQAFKPTLIYCMPKKITNPPVLNY